jgi:uncharacterized Zn-binding protein involved in type VI secretion
MPGVARLGDISTAIADTHGCPACPHPVSGPAIVGSPDVMVNGLPILRVGDSGIHTACCGPNTWCATHGSCSVFANGKMIVRREDPIKHCGAIGKMAGGSKNVNAGP